MNKMRSAVVPAARLGVSTVVLLLAPWALVRADKGIEERHPVDPLGQVEIVNVAGSVDVKAWDMPEIEVSGSMGSSVERVDVTTVGTRTSVHVVTHPGHWGEDGKARIVLRVPLKNAVSATLVSADFTITGVQGDLKLQSVSGDVSGDVGGDVHANTVSGSVRLAARNAKAVEIRTVSGDVELTTRSSDVEITTVSGNARITLEAVSHARFKSVSGDLSVALALAPDAELDGESVSGDIHFEFPRVPGADFDIQSVSGNIENCFGPKPSESRYGPGSRLVFKNGTDRTRVRVETKSGDVQLCTKDGRTGAARGARAHNAGLLEVASASRAATPCAAVAATPARAASAWPRIPYVL